MFLSRIFITPGAAGHVYKDVVEQCLQKLANTFSELRSHINAANHFVEFEGLDEPTSDRIETFLKDQKWDYDLVIEEKCSDSELVKARFIPLLVEGDYIDDDNIGNPLNHYRNNDCQTCLLAKDDIIPTPYVVSGTRMRKSQDLYLAHNGIRIASERCMLILQKKAGDIIDYGEVCVDGGGKKTPSDGPFFWFRPK